MVELAKKVDTKQPTRQSLAVAELHDSEVEDEAWIALEDVEVEEDDDFPSSLSSSLSLFPARQSPIVTPKTLMQLKLNSGIWGHANLMFVRPDAKPQINISSP